jgi:chemotaxis protein MotB
MSKGSEDAQPQQLVIVRRRRGGHDDGHHGGVWKIAYADFMTAMMAFFLVMWLINSTDEKTIVQVAAYFNPVRLSEKSPSSKGLNDASQVAPAHPGDTGGVEQGKDAVPAAADKKEKPPSKKEKKKKEAQEQELLTNPYEMLDQIASKAPRNEPVGGYGVRHIGDLRGASGQALRDPYDPVYPRIGTGLASDTKHDAPPELREFPGGPVEGPSNEPAPTTPNSPAAPKSETRAALKVTALDRRAVERQMVEHAERRVAVQVAASQLEAELDKVIDAIGDARPLIDVKVTDEGVLISLTDNNTFGMFAIGSAQPDPRLVVAMEKIGAILKARDGRIIIRGHTDGRQYKTNLYDNWRLSSARAQMVYYMLVRGGIPETRFERIEGHADRTLRVPTDKDAAQNRRIEILLRVGS